MAQLAAVRVRIPCIRDAPRSPNQRAMDHLGLGPGDADIIKDAYAKSNKRVTDQLHPAKRLANAPEMCSDRRVLRASDEREERRGPQQRDQRLNATLDPRWPSRRASRHAGLPGSTMRQSSGRTS